MARIRVSASRPSRLTNTATETLSTESRFTTERRGDRVGTGFQNNLASESPDGRGARCDEYYRSACGSAPVVTVTVE
jgi:hypothetical protein